LIQAHRFLDSFLTLLGAAIVSGEALALVGRLEDAPFKRRDFVRQVGCRRPPFRI
jgi:hypothetical protein